METRRGLTVAGIRRRGGARLRFGLRCGVGWRRRGVRLGLRRGNQGSRAGFGRGARRGSRRFPLRGRAAREEDGADGMGPPVSGRAGDASYRPSGVGRAERGQAGLCGRSG